MGGKSDITKPLQPALISVGAGTNQLPLITNAKKLGYAVISVDRDPEACGFQYSDVCINNSTHDVEAIISSLAVLQQSYTFTGCVARTTGIPLYTSVAIAERFGLRGLTKEIVLIATEKSYLKKFCLGQKLPVPSGLTICTEEKLSDLLHFMPAIVKPDCTSIGKNGIKLCSTHDEAYVYAKDAINDSVNRRAIIETFIPGIDATCLCHTHGGHVSIIAWWDELVGIDINKKIIGLGVSVPSVICGTVAQERAEKIIELLIANFSDVDALLLFSFRITMDAEPYLVELHADLGGDLIADILLPAANFDFNYFEVAIQVATGSYQQRKPIKFAPTLLYYFKDKIDYSTAFRIDAANCLLVKNNTALENMANLSDVLCSTGPELSILPMHYDWIQKNSPTTGRC